MRFRQGRIEISADIEAMFMQVLVPEDDQRTFRFLWREDPQGKIEIFQYTRHIFGAKDSPTCALYALNKTAQDNCEKFPEAAEVVLRNFYMDDLLKSVDSEELATRLAASLEKLLKKGGFRLTKWNSNVKEILTQLPKDTLSANQQSMDLGNAASNETQSHVLGLKWVLPEDTLAVCRGTTIQVPTVITQRLVLKLVSSVFDPLGIVSPFTMRARLILKQIWKTQGQAWDVPV